ncbi:MAG: SirA-like protein [Moraxellaceae bacterium]|jgi:tRNA 2-thiouridine synthesizing protein A|nr:SirA-like protein [Moraxellaceae bacterium]
MKEEMHQLDARRLLCPIPVIRTQNAIRGLKAGDRLLVVATDPGVMHDIPAWCRIHGHVVLSAEAVDGEFHLRIEVGHEHHIGAI